MERTLDLSLDELAKRCATETERFFRRAAHHDNQFCFELWRRAFADRNQAAWTQIYQQYQGLVSGWISAHPQFAATDEEPSYFVNAVFAGIWKSCPPERFVNFSDLPAVLAYLKSCVHTTIINHLRKRRIVQAEIADELLGDAIDPMPTLVLERLARAELWQLLNPLLYTEQERLLTELYFIQGMKPRMIYAQYSEAFDSIQEVYRVKQNLLERLSRNAELQQFHKSLRENQ